MTLKIFAEKRESKTKQSGDCTVSTGQVAAATAATAATTKVDKKHKKQLRKNIPYSLALQKIFNFCIYVESIERRGV